MADGSKTRSEYLKIMFGQYGNEALEQINTLNASSIAPIDTTSTMVEMQNKSPERNWWQRTVDTVSDAVNDIVRGTFDFIDDVLDFGANTIAEWGWIDEGARQGFVNQDWQSGATEVVSRFGNFGLNILNGDVFTEEHWDIYDSDNADDFLNKAAIYQAKTDAGSWTNENKDIKNFVDSLTTGFGYMIPSITVGVATGGSGALPVMAVGAGMGAFNEAYEETGGDYGKSLGYGIASGSVEAASELVVGKLLGALGLGTGKIMGAFGKESSESVVKLLSKTFIEEGAEEAFSGVLEPTLQAIYKGKDAFKTESGDNIYFDSQFWKDIGNQALVGGTLGSLMGSVDVVVTHKALGNDGIKIANSLEEISKDQTKLEKTKDVSKREKISKRIAENVFKTAETFKNGKFNETQLENIAKLLKTPQAFINELKTSSEEFNKQINNQIQELGDFNKFKVRNLFNTLQEQANTNIDLVFDDSIEENGNYDPKTNTITLKSANAELLAHEYLGHALGDNLSDIERQSIFEKIVKTDWFSKNNGALRKAYIDNSLDDINRKRLWQSEVISNYLEHTLKAKDIADIKLRKSIKDKLFDVFKFNKNSILKNDVILNEFLNDVESLLKITDKDLHKVVKKYLKNKPLTDKEKALISKDLQFFKELKKYSEKLSVENEQEKSYNKSYGRTNDFRRIQKESRAISSEELFSFRSGSTRLSQEQLRRFSSVFQREIDTVRNSKHLNESTLLNKKTNNNITFVENIDGNLFHDIFEICRNYLKNGELVDIHDSYDNCKCYLSDDGLSGFAIEENGNLVSVFNLGEKGFLDTISDYIKEKGAIILDCYNSPNQPLAKMYERKLGFKTASIMDYNMEYDHDDIAENHNSPKVAFMVNTSKDVKTKHFNKDQYDEAQKYQLSFLETESEFSKAYKKLNKFNDYEKRILNNNYNIILESENDVNKYINDSINNVKNLSSNALIGKLSDDVSSKIFKDTGFDVKDYAFAFTKDNIKHIYNRHILNGANQIKINVDDIFKSISFIQDYDSIKLDVDKFGVKRLIATKNIGNTYLIAIMISSKNKRLSLNSLYCIKKGAGSPTLHAITDNSKALLAATSETKIGTSSPLSTKNIDKKGNEVKNNDSKDDSLDGQGNKKRSHSTGYVTNVAPRNDFSINNIESNENSSKQKDVLEPYETNKADVIKEIADSKEGKVIKYNKVIESYNDLLDTFEVDVKVNDKSQKMRALFEQYNLAPNKVKAKNLRAFVDDIFNSKVDKTGLTLNEYFNELGYDVDKYKNQFYQGIFNVLDKNAYDSKTTRKINSLISQLEEAKKLYRQNLMFVRESNSLKEQLRKDIEDKVKGLQESSGVPKLFKHLLSEIRFARQGYASNTNVKRFSDVFNDTSFQSVLNDYKETTDLDIDILKEVGQSLCDSYNENAKIMSSEQVSLLRSFLKGFKKAYSMSNSNEIAKVREEARELNRTAKMVFMRKKMGGIKNTITSAMLDAMNQKELISYMFDGEEVAMKKIYKDLIVDPYNKQVAKYVEFKNVSDSITKLIQRNRYKKVKFNNIKVPRYVLYQFYLNTLSNDNLSKMQDNKLTYNNNGTISEFDFDTFNGFVSEELTEAEIRDLKKLFTLYNSDVKDYVKEISERNFGFSVSRENYYPIIASEIYKNSDLTNMSSLRFQINAMSNNNLKSITNAKTKIELNVDPIQLFDRYIESMTISGEIGLASRKLSRLFNLKLDDHKSLSDTIHEYMPNSKKDYVAYVYNQLIKNVQTVERSSVFDRLVGNFSTATLGLNISPMLKQFGSVFTPLSEINFKAWLKGLNPIYGLNKKARTYLKEHSGIFALRLYDKGYMKSVTLAPDDVNRVIKKIGEASMFMIEKTDRYVCYLTYGMAQQQAKLLGYGEIGTEENLKAAIDIFHNLLLNTQSNSDRIAVSKIRSGNKGVLAKYLFGMFQADAQAKVSLVSEYISKAVALNSENKNLEPRLKKLYDDEYQRVIQNERKVIESKLKKANDKDKAQIEKQYSEFVSAQKEKYNELYESEVNRRRNDLPKLQKENNAKIAKVGVALVGSALITTLASMLANYIYDRDKEPEEYLFEMLLETFTQWVPYVNTLINAIQYESTSFAPVESINGIAKAINSLINDGYSKRTITNLVISLSQFIGLPLNNLMKLVNGILGKFDTKTALAYKSLLYGTTPQYLAKETNKYIQKGDLKKASEILEFDYALNKVKVNEKVAYEIVKLKAQGQKISLPDKPEDSKQIEIYERLNDALLNFINRSDYNSLSAKSKANLINRLAKIYYDYSIGNKTKYSKLLDKNIDVSKYLFGDYDNKKDLLKVLNETSYTFKEKLLSAYLSGYNLTKENMKIVENFVN